MKTPQLIETLRLVTGIKAKTRKEAIAKFWEYCYNNEVVVNPDYIDLDPSVSGKETEEDGYMFSYTLYRYGQPNQDNICSFLLVKEYDGGNCGTGFKFTGDNSDVQDLVGFFIS